MAQVNLIKGTQLQAETITNREVAQYSLEGDRLQALLHHLQTVSATSGTTVPDEATNARIQFTGDGATTATISDEGINDGAILLMQNLTDAAGTVTLDVADSGTINGAASYEMAAGTSHLFICAATKEWIAFEIPPTTGGPAVEMFYKTAQPLAVTTDAGSTGVTAGANFRGPPLVMIQGIPYELGDGVKTDCQCFFSGDSGSTARGFDEIISTDVLYWNALEAGTNLVAAAGNCVTLFGMRVVS